MSIGTTIVRLQNIFSNYKTESDEHHSDSSDSSTIYSEDYSEYETMATDIASAKREIMRLRYTPEEIEKIDKNITVPERIELEKKVKLIKIFFDDTIYLYCDYIKNKKELVAETNKILRTLNKCKTRTTQPLPPQEELNSIKQAEESIAQQLQELEQKSPNQSKCCILI